MTPELAKARKAVDALRIPDAAFKSCPNTVRQSLADIIERLLAELKLRRDVINELEAEAARLTAIADAARTLVSRMEEIYEHPAFQSVWTVNQLHVGPYKGPKWDVESNALKAALSHPTTEPAKAERP